jgi:hypothetical protein
MSLLSNEAKLNAVGLVVTATGMVLQMASGSTLYPTLTGPIVLVAGAALVAFRPGGWTSYVGLVIPLVLGVGLAVSAVLSPAFVTQLTDLGSIGMAVGSMLHVAGLTASVIGGVAMVRRPQGRGSSAARGAR